MQDVKEVWRWMPRQRRVVLPSPPRVAKFKVSPAWCASTSTGFTGSPDVPSTLRGPTALHFDCTEE